MTVERSRYRLDVDATAFRAHARDLEEYTRKSTKGVAEIERGFARMPASVKRAASRLSDAFRYVKAGSAAAAAFAREMHGVESATSGAADEAGRLERFASGAKGWLAGILGGAGAAAALRYLYGLGDAAQTARTSFTTLLHSEREADAFLRKMAAFAASTPFDLQGLKENVRYMLAMGFEGRETLPVLEAIGDAVSSLGGGTEQIESVIRALGQMRQKQKVSAEELNQLAEVGIGGWKYLAEEFGVSIGEVQDKAQKGALDVNRSVNAIVEGMRREFAGGMANLSETASGALSTVRDIADQTATAITAGAFDEFTADLRAIRDGLESASASAESGALDVWADRVAYAYRVGREFVKMLLEWGPTAIKVYAVAKALGVVVTVTTAVSRVMLGYRLATAAATVAQTAFNSRLAAGAAGMTAFNVAVGANPIGLLVTALGAVVTAIAAFRIATAASTDANRAENRALERRLQLIRELDGATLARRRRQYGEHFSRQVDNLQDLREERRMVESGEYQFHDRRVVSSEGRDAQARIETADEQREKALARLDRLIRGQESAMRGTMRLAGEVEETINSNLDTRLAALEEEIRLRTAINRELTREEQAEVDGLKVERDRVQAQLDARRQSGGDTGGPTAAELRRQQAAQRKAAEEAEDSARRRAEAEGIVVEAQRNAATDQLIHENDLARERLARSRQVAEAEIALKTDAEQRAKTAFDVAAEYDRLETELALEGIRLRERAAIEAADAALARERIRARAIEDGAERQAVLDAAEERSTQAKTEAAREAVLARERIESEAQGKRLAREREYTDAFVAEAERRREVMNRIANAPAPDVGATLAKGVIDEMEADVQRARVRLGQGLIDTDAFRQEVDELKARAREALREIADEMVRLGLLTKEAADALVNGFDAAEAPDFSQAISDLTAMRDLADDVSRTFQALGQDVLADVTRGLGDVLDAVGRLKYVERQRAAGAEGFTGLAGELAGLGSYVGVATAAFGVAQSVVSAAVAQAEESRRQREAIREAAAATRDNTAALRSAAQPASGVSRDEIDAARDLIAELSGGVGRAYSRKYIDPFGVADANALAAAGGRFADYLDRIDAMGIDGLSTGPYRDLFEQMVAMIDTSKGDAYVQAMTDAIVRGLTTGDFGDFPELAAMVGDGFVSLAEAAGDVANALGTYADDLGGALAEADDAIELLGLEGQAAFDEFLRMVRQADEDLGSLAGVLSAAEAGDVDAAVAAAFEAIRNGSFDFGSLSADEVEDVLRRLRFGAGGAGLSSSSQATSISSITQVQGNLLLGYQQEQLRAQRAILEQDELTNRLLSQIYGVLGAAAAPPVPTDAARASLGTGGATSPAPTTVNVGGITVQHSGAWTRDTIRQVARDVEDELVRKYLGPDTRGIVG